MMSGLIPPPNVLAAFAGGAGRSPSYWNARFSHWYRPASDSEDDRITRTLKIVKDALSSHSPLLSACNVFAKGSYKNNTNIRTDSDIDICVLSPSIVTGSDWREICTYSQLGLVENPGKTNGDIFQELKLQIHIALLEKFGVNGSVVRGNKAFSVHASAGSRVDADVVPALTYYNVFPRSHWSNPYTATKIVGTAFFSDNLEMIVNYPDHCYDNGVAKNTVTSKRYKRAVRIIKHLKNEMQSEHTLNSLAPAPPSFLIESLCWNVPDHVYLNHSDLFDMVVATLKWLSWSTSDSQKELHLLEVNSIKLLFAEAGVYKQPWNRWQAHAFVNAALRHLGVS